MRNDLPLPVPAFVPYKCSDMSSRCPYFMSYKRDVLGDDTDRDFNNYENWKGLRDRCKLNGGKMKLLHIGFCSMNIVTAVVCCHSCANRIYCNFPCKSDHNTCGCCDENEFSKFKLEWKAVEE